MVTPNKDIWDSITVVVATDALYEEFKYVNSGLLEQRGEKNISEILSILSSAEVKRLSIKAIRITNKPAYMLKKKNQKHKAMTISKNKYINCHKMGHFRRDCRMPDYRLLKKKSTDNARQDCDNSPRPKPHNQYQQKANVAAVNHKEGNSDLEPFYPGRAFTTIESNIMSKTKSM